MIEPLPLGSRRQTWTISCVSDIRRFFRPLRPSITKEI